jgi:hypothetical protein
MDGRQHLEAAIAARGGTSKAAREWDIPYPSLRSVENGWRGVSRKQAAAWAAKSNGELKADLLVWIRPVKKQGQAA